MILGGGSGKSGKKKLNGYSSGKKNQLNNLEEKKIQLNKLEYSTADWPGKKKTQLPVGQEKKTQQGFSARGPLPPDH